MVADDGMVDRAYAEAIGTQGVVTGTTAYARCMARVHRSRGKAMIEVLCEPVPDSEARGQAADSRSTVPKRTPSSGWAIRPSPERPR